MHRDQIKYVAAVLATAALYFAAARLGFMVAYSAEQVTLIWPPAGIALATLLVGGSRYWPGIALGAFVANLTVAAPILAAAGIAGGNTLEAVVGASLLRRVIQFRNPMDRVKDALGLVLLAAGLSTAVSATIGVTSLCSAGVYAWSDFERLWRLWWMGDAMGDLVVAPLILAWSNWPMRRWNADRWAEAAALLFTVVAVSFSVFAGSLPMLLGYPLEYTVFPLLIWGALRFGQPGATGVSFVTATIAVFGTVWGHGPFAGRAREEDLFLSLAFMAVVAVTGLVLAAATLERSAADRHRAAGFAVTRVLAESNSMANATPRLLRAVCETIGWEVGAYWVVDEQSGTLRCSDFWNAPDMPVPDFEAVTRQRTFRAGVGLPGRVWQNRAPVWIIDVVVDKNFPRAGFAARNGLRGGFGFPVLAGPTIHGVIEFFSREVQPPDERLLQFMASLGDHVGQFIERRKAEELLREHAAKLAEQAHLLDLAHVLIRDMSGRIVFWNRGAVRMYGWSAAEAVGQVGHDLLRTEFPQPRDAVDAELLERGQWTGELLHTRRDGSRVVVASHWSLHRDAGGTPTCVIEVNNDVTELRRAREALQDADRRKDEFLAMLAHELRNPLAAISNASQVLEQAPAARPEERAIREILSRQTRHLARMVDDLMDVSRVLRGMVKLQLESIDLATLLRRVEQSIRPLADQRRLELSVAGEHDPLYVDADPTRMEQVVVNLLHNAIKYTEPNGHIRLSATRQDGQACIEVSDDGIGIAPEVLPHIFDLFRQAESALGRSQGGLGIGLTLVRRTVEMHGGTVQVQSDGPGRGARFTVRLPLAAVVHGNGDGTQARLSAVARRVLVVDDNPDVAESLRLLLQSLGNQVWTAGDGPKALETVSALRPDLVLLDIGLPIMDGYEVARRIRQRDPSRSVVLVALTGWGQDEDRRKSREAGFDHHLVKPVSTSMLFDVLASAGGGAA